MKKQFFAAAMILALGAGFTACSSDDLNVKEQKTAKSGKEATTYLTYTLTVAAPGGTRASNPLATPAGGNDNQTDDESTHSPSYNFIERWKGSDKITKVTAYIYDGDQDDAQFNQKVETVAGQFDFVHDENDKTVIKPKHGIKVSVGKKTVFLVVNSTADVDNLLDNIQSLGEFKKAYESANLAFAGRTATASASATAHATAADQLVTFNADNTATFVMTGAPVSKEVEAGITEEQTVGTAHGAIANNRFNFTVKRAVATVFVTSKQDTNHKYVVLKGDNPTTKDVREKDATLATVSELTFSQAQGEQKLYFQQKRGDNTTAYQTPAYDFVLQTTATDADYVPAKEKYDYVGLWKSNPVTSRSQGVLQAGDGEAVVKTATVVPFLPATHAYTAEGTNYNEGNTAYVLVRVKLEPTYVYKLKGTELVAEDYTAADGAKFFYGSDGKFYATLDALNKAAETNTGLTAKEFVNNKGIYTVWINPDTPTGKEWKNSPTNRNNIYHISINDIKSMPENWNPLVPGSFTGGGTPPNTPVDPNNPVPNPDPRPGDNPKEPPSVHNPHNPLSPVSTWMSVDATILPWSIHSYGVEL